jgi:hypothetical protein
LIYDLFDLIFLCRINSSANRAEHAPAAKYDTESAIGLFNNSTPDFHVFCAIAIVKKRIITAVSFQSVNFLKNTSCRCSKYLTAEPRTMIWAAPATNTHCIFSVCGTRLSASPKAIRTRKQTTATPAVESPCSGRATTKNKKKKAQMHMPKSDQKTVCVPIVFKPSAK